MKVSRPLVIIDLETTGTWKERDKIIEIGMVKVLPDGSRQVYLKRVNPGISIPASVSELTGITDVDVMDAPEFADIVGEVLEFLGDSDIAGFSIERFDIPLLERECDEAGRKLEMSGRVVYDAQKIYHIHERRDLTAAYQFYCNKSLDAAHTALGDVEATLEVLAEQVRKYGSESDGIESLREIDHTPTHINFDRDGRFRWWNGQLYPTFGKHAGRMNIRELYENDRDYLHWIMARDFSPEVKQMVGNVLRGCFPECPGEL